VLEAAFIILVGVIAAVLSLTPLAIVIVMGLAWVVVALVEQVAKSPGRPARVARRDAAPPRERVAVPIAEEPPPAAPQPDAEPRRRLRFSEPRAATVALDAESPREWNLWELETRAREHAGADAVPHEWAATFMYLREFAKSDGTLPSQFDSLVRESFPELTRVTT
jgi:hypothetical protein